MFKGIHTIEPDHASAMGPMERGNPSIRSLLLLGGENLCMTFFLRGIALLANKGIANRCKGHKKGVEG